MKSIKDDLNMLLDSNMGIRRKIFSKIEAEITYYKKHEFNTTHIKNTLVEFINKMSANKFDKSQDRQILFIKDSLLYLCDRCDL